MSRRIQKILALACLSAGLAGCVVAQDADEATRRYEALYEQYDELYQQGRYQEAAAIGEKVIALLKDTGERRPGRYAVSHHNLAVLYQKLGEYEKAEPLLLESLRTWAWLLGEEDPIYASNLVSLAGLYESMGAYEKAEPLLLQARVILARDPGEDPSGYFRCLNDLAALYVSKASFEKAERLFRETREVGKRVLGEDHPEYATVLDNLAGMHVRLGAYEEAEALFLQGREIRARALGEVHPDYAGSLHNLATLYMNMGAYEEAEPLYLKAGEIKARLLGEEHPSHATTLNNLATMYFEMGAYEKAEPLFLRAEKIRARVLGEEHPDYATTLNNLASLYREVGDYEKAERWYLRAGTIEARVLGEHHPDYATTLSNLAGLIAVMGNFERAESLYLEARDIQARALGEAHPNYATTLNNLAELYTITGAFEQAESLYREAKEIVARTLGEEQPYHIKILGNLARLHVSTGDPARAEALARESVKLERKLLSRVFAAFPEKDRESFLRTLGTWTLPCLLENGPLAAEAALAFKGAIAASLLEERRLSSAAADPEAKDLVNRLKVLRRRFHWTTLQGLDSSEKVEALFSEIETVEKQLARSVAGIGDARRSVQVETDTVRETLPPDTALVEYLRFSPPVPAGRGSSPEKPGDRYGAVVILSALKGGEPVFVELGAAEEVDAAIERFRALLTIHQEGEEAVTRAARLLYRLLLEPLESTLAEETTLVLSPDSQLHFLCFEPLLDDEDRMACEKWNLRMSDTGRDLLEPAREPETRSKRALILGDAAFDAETPSVADDIDSADRRLQSDLASSLALGMRADVSGISFGPLPGTRNEAETLAAALDAAGWETTTNFRREATERQLREHIPGRQVVHLATHGFFLHELPIGRDRPGNLVGITDENRHAGAIQDPMVRGGLALASANRTLHSWLEGTVPDPSNDGILSAAEAVTLDLAGTELLVLSACETARGRALDGEGIYGLRRAFKLAGADSVVMTLWSIADQYTVGFMKDLYTRYLAGQHPAVALAETKKEHLIALRARYGLRAAIQFAGPFLATGKGVEAVALE